MKNFNNPEPNHLFRVVVAVETAIQKLQKKFEDGNISAEAYVLMRQEIQSEIKKSSEAIESKCLQMLTKNHHIQG